MKKISSNILFYVTIAEAFLFLFLILFPMFYFEFFFISSAPMFIFATVSVLCMVGYVYYHMVVALYKAIKIHQLKRTQSYIEIRKLLEIQRKTLASKTLPTNDVSENKGVISEEQELLHGFLLSYVWLRNPNIQKALNAFLCSGLLLMFIIFEYISILLILLTFVLFLFGFIKFFKGYIEIA